MTRPIPTPFADLVIREGLEGLSPSRIRTLYRRAPLRRNVNKAEDLWKMFEEASLVLTAWRDDHLIGIARVLTDGVLFSFLCDLAVEPDVQGVGIGRALLEAVKERCKGTELLLRDTQVSTAFYRRNGFKRVENGWFLPGR